MNVKKFNLVKDHTKVLGFGTNRVVGKQLDKSGLSVGQMKSMSTLQNLCGVKKTEADKNLLEKISSKKVESKSKLLSSFEGENLTYTRDRKKENIEPVAQPNTEQSNNTQKKKISLRNLL